MVVLTIESEGKTLKVRVARGKQKLKITMGESSIIITPEEAALLANFIGDACEGIPVKFEGDDTEIQGDKM